MSNVLDFEPAASGSPPTDIELCSATSERLRDEQYALEDALGDGTSPRKVLAAVAARLADDPDWIEGLTLRGHLRVDDGCIDAARADFRRAYETGLKLLPRRYSGWIEWCYLDNRPFLRAASAYAHVFCRLGRWRDAIPLFRKLLRWNPNDNQGIRYSLGPALLRAGRIRSARAALWRLADENPAMAYELGLLEVGEAEWTAAATALRKAGIANPYIAPLLCGMVEPPPMALWMGCSLNDETGAFDYVDFWGSWWAHVPEALPFLGWLHTHPRVMGERAAALAPAEELLWEHDFECRGAIRARREALPPVTDELSAELVRPRSDGRHGCGLPWRLVAACRADRRRLR